MYQLTHLEAMMQPGHHLITQFSNPGSERKPQMLGLCDVSPAAAPI